MTRCSWLIAGVVVCLGPSGAQAHGIATHLNITSAAVELVKQRVTELNCLNDTRLKQGTIGEDDAPRYMFHFTPPVNGTVNVSEYLPNRTVNSSCSSIDWGLMTDGSPACTQSGGLPINSTTTLRNTHSWAVAVAQAKAPNGLGWTELGYVLHLLQDLTSPAHTRNDPHPFGDETDPIEAVTRVPRIPTEPLLEFTSPMQAFTELQQWTQSNFYSKDTVFAPGLPGPAAAGVRGEYFVDAQGNLIAHRGAAYLLSGTNEANRNKIYAGIDTYVADEQWRRLGPKAVLYAASLIKHYHTTAKPLTCDAITITEATCVPGYQSGLQPGQTPVPVNIWTVKGTAQTLSSQAKIMVEDLNYTYHGQFNTRSTCDIWTGIGMDQLSNRYCARLPFEPPTTNWSSTFEARAGIRPGGVVLRADLTTIDAPLFNSGGEFYIADSRRVLPSSNACPATYKF